MALVTVATFVAVWVATLARLHFDNIDEVVYAFQAHRFVLGDATLPADSTLQRFVKLPLMVATPVGLYSQYPPGYPAILALFIRLGIPSLCGATLAALAALATYRLGASVATTSVGILAAALLASHDVFLRWASMYMSHLPALTALICASWLLLDALKRTDRRGDLQSVAGGLLLGVAIAVRPVTGLALGISICLWLLSRGIGWSRLRRLSVMTCVGLAVPAAAMLAYNSATNGDPFQLGYRAAQGPLNDLGFGPRGIILYDRDVRPVVQATQFTFRDAVRHEVAYAAWPLARDLVPVWGLLPLLAVAIAYRVRVRVAVVAAFAVLPIVNFFFYANGERFHVELLPFVLLGAALVVHRVREVDPRAASALALFLIGANVATSATRLAGDWWQRARSPSDIEVIARAVRDSSAVSPRLLVLVRNPPLAERLFIGLWRFNLGTFPGSVVVARDLGPENAQLACRLPGYRVLLAEATTTARDAHLVSYPGGMVAPARCDLPRLVPSSRTE